MYNKYNHRYLKVATKNKKKKQNKLVIFLILVIVVLSGCLLRLNPQVTNYLAKIKPLEIKNFVSSFKATQQQEIMFEFYDNNRTEEIEIYSLNLLNTQNFALADKLKAHVILLGMSANIQTVKKNYLVTSGPYYSLKAVNQAKNRLLKHKIKSTLVVKKIKKSKHINSTVNG